MTREEAIIYIMNLREYMKMVSEESEYGFIEENYIALDMAIKILEQEPCEDAVSRKEVLEVFDEWINSREDWNEHPVWFARSLVSLPSVTPTQRWIPVSDRLPEKNMACLVSVGKLNLTQIAMYSDLMQTINHKIFHQGDYGHDSFKDITEYVNAWMPLPKPYRAEEEKKQC